MPISMLLEALVPRRYQAPAMLVSSPWTVWWARLQFVAPGVRRVRRVRRVRLAEAEDVYSRRPARAKLRALGLGVRASGQRAATLVFCALQQPLSA